MAELATIARPYAEALVEAAPKAEAAAWVAQVQALAAVAADAQLLQFANHPKAQAAQVAELLVSVAKVSPAAGVRNLLDAVIENGRLEALPEIAAQAHALVNAGSGVADATVYSAFPIEAAQLAELSATLEKRFGRKLAITVETEPSLIGGVRVVVGDEVLDTSVKARLERMKVALTA
ncbi:F0F1 ATP synthase subunit delta [Caldimonas sp. KR1-144]|uniref:F0F1 ATP synthase subunit delta n=1 Tax=Caldimonas sp. KR1-144 TaxID=3400911 RepID=UPI003C0D7A39